MVLGWWTTEVYYLLLTPFHGFEAAGVLRAAYNLVAPALQGFTALSTVALPLLAGARARGALRRLLPWAGAGFAATGVLYSLLLIVLAEPLVDLLYGEAYSGIVPVVRIVALVAATTALARLSMSVLHAHEHPRAIFEAFVPGAVVTATAGLWLTGVHGPIGAAVGFAVTSGLVTVVLVVKAARRSWP